VMPTGIKRLLRTCIEPAEGIRRNVDWPGDRLRRRDRGPPSSTPSMRSLGLRSRLLSRAKDRRWLADLTVGPGTCDRRGRSPRRRPAPASRRRRQGWHWPRSDRRRGEPIENRGPRAHPRDGRPPWPSLGACPPVAPNRVDGSQRRSWPHEPYSSKGRPAIAGTVAGRPSRPSFRETVEARLPRRGYARDHPSRARGRSDDAPDPTPGAADGTSGHPRTRGYG
jgi:hypothetical protein